MKILYFYQYFTTPNGSYGTRVYEFTREWVKQGHDVTVVSSIYYKSDLRATKMIDRRNIDGINVILLNIWIDNKQSFLGRIWGFIKYSFLASYFALVLKADIIVASSGPLTVGIPGLLGRYIRGRKLIFEVRDLWPQGAIELGLLNNKLLQNASYWFEKVCYKASSHIIALSPGMSMNIQNRFGFQNVTSVTNSANIELFKPGYNNQIKSTFGMYAIYTGNIGLVNNSFWLVDAARLLKNLKSDIKILIIGDGQQRKQIEKIKTSESLDNLIILDLMPKNILIGYIQNAMASLVPLNGQPILDTSSPNKFFESLAAGVLVIQNTNGWMRDFLEKHDVGFTLSPDNPVELANTLLDISKNEVKRIEMGLRARKVAVENFDKKILASKMLDVICHASN